MPDVTPTSRDQASFPPYGQRTCGCEANTLLQRCVAQSLNINHYRSVAMPLSGSCFQRPSPNTQCFHPVASCGRHRAFNGVRKNCTKKYRKITTSDLHSGRTMRQRESQVTSTPPQHTHPMSPQGRSVHHATRFSSIPLPTHQTSELRQRRRSCSRPRLRGACSFEARPHAPGLA